MGGRVGPHGICVVTLKTGGIPESLPVTDPEREEIINNRFFRSCRKRSADGGTDDTTSYKVAS
jgi:hypothetical protein